MIDGAKVYKLETRARLYGPIKRLFCPVVLVTDQCDLVAVPSIFSCVMIAFCNLCLAR